MNRGGLAGTVFELDDRFTAYDAEQHRRRRLRGRQDAAAHRPRRPGHRRHAGVLRAARSATWPARGLMAMVEPFISHRVDGRVRNDLTAEAVVRSADASPPGSARTAPTPGSSCRSSTTWSAVMAATTLPALLLGGEVAGRPGRRVRALGEGAGPARTVRGLVVGRSLLYPPDDDVAAAVDTGGGAAVSDATRQRDRPRRQPAEGVRLVDHAGARRLGLQRPAGPRARRRRRARVRHRRGRDARAAAGRARARSTLRRRDASTLAGRARRLRRRHRLRLRAARRRRSPITRRGRRPVRAAVGPRASGGCRSATGPAEDVPVELRGAGQASRQVNNFCTPDAFEADTLIACEVLTPGGNWSSYPPHKHDEAERRASPSSRRSTTSRSPTVPPAGQPGIGYQRVYGHAGKRDRRPAPRSAPATSCSSRTAGTARRWPRPATTSTTST